MNSEHACKPPHHILGLTIRSRTRIYVSYVIPNILELFVYITQTVADGAVSYQHFKSQQPDFGWATLSLILIPPVLTGIFVLSSKSQWIEPKQNGKHVKFICVQISQMLLFPFFVIYRSAKLIFWSIEALFHDNDDIIRMECLERAEECSTCELYRLIQAYGQSAPQIILQLFHMLSQDLFRNFQTTNVQAISLVFSAIDLASVTTSYQRFESQKQVGRYYPWSTKQQMSNNDLKIIKNKCFQEECVRRKHDAERTLSKFPESDKIMENFKAKIQSNTTNNHYIATYSNLQSNSRGSLADISESFVHTVQVHSLDGFETQTGDEQTTLLATHLTDDDKMKTKPTLHLNSDGVITSPDEFDRAPNSPPPLPPRASNLNDNEALHAQTPNQTDVEVGKRRSKVFSQLEIFKDMLFINAQLYIKEKVPRPPKILIKRIEDTKKQCNTPTNSPKTPPDVVDFSLPVPTKVINGIQQDDFAAKTIAFFGWLAFGVMRMLSLSAFSVFYPKAFLIIMGVHYLIMLASLYIESQFKGKWNRNLFYFSLAYVYLFVLLEFRVKFKNVRLWFVAYLLLSMTENLTMTLVWYYREEFESWWFDFIFEGIMYSGLMFLATVMVYYLILKPKDVVFLVQDEGST